MKTTATIREVFRAEISLHYSNSIKSEYHIRTGDILALLDDIDELLAERDSAFERGRQRGREDVGKYSNAIGRIEAVFNICGVATLSETVQAVVALKAERDRLREALQSIADGKDGTGARIHGTGYADNVQRFARKALEVKP